MNKRQNAIQKAREYQSVRPIFLDTETTGLDAKAEIIEVCIVDFDGSILVDSLIKPISTIPPDVVRVHGITNELVQDSPTWPEVWPMIESALRGRYIGIYKADFDMRLIRQTNQNYGMIFHHPLQKIIDLMKLYTEFSGIQRWQTLEAAGRQCNIPLSNTHRAKDDTMLLRALFQHIASRSL